MGNLHNDILVNKLFPDPPQTMRAIPTTKVKTASGESILLTDSIDAPFQGLKLFGKSTQDGTPSPENPVPIVSACDDGQIEVGVYGGNLIDANNFNSQVREYETGERIELINNGNGSLTVTGTTPTNRYFVTVGYDIPLQDGEYTLTANGNFDDGVFIILRMFLKNNTSKDFEISKNKRYRNFLVNTKEINRAYIFTQTSPGYSVDCTFFPILNYGTNPILWEPYTKQSLTYPTPNGLPGIPVSSGGNYTDESGQQWVCDEVDFGRGVYVKRIQGEEITLNRDVYNTPVGFRYTSKQNSKKLSRQYTEVISERFKYSDKAGIASLNDKNGIRASGEYNIIVAQDQETIAETPSVTTSVYYIIENTEEIPLTPAELSAYAALHTNYPTTTVMNDAGAGMEVGYKAVVKEYKANALRMYFKANPII